MLSYTEVSASNLPVVVKQAEDQLTIEQVIYLGEDLNNYEEVALIEVNSEKQLFEKLYSKK